jgi:hypothetical protein
MSSDEEEDYGSDDDEEDEVVTKKNVKTNIKRKPTSTVKNPNKKAKISFIDDAAELSGSDIDSEDDEEEGKKEITIIQNFHEKKMLRCINLSFLLFLISMLFYRGRR